MKSYSQFVTESRSEYAELYEYYENLVEEGVLVENPLLKLGGRMIPGLGAAYYGYDAAERLKKGDWGGAALSGLGAATSFGGPVAALLPAGIQMATDYMGLTGDKSIKKNQTPPKTPPKTPPQTPPKPGDTSSYSGDSGYSGGGYSDGGYSGGGTAPAPASSPASSTVLALKGGVQGTLDKATGKFTPKNFSDAERARYTAAGGKIPSQPTTPAAPKPAPAKPAPAKPAAPTAVTTPVRGPVGREEMVAANIQRARTGQGSRPVMNRSRPTAVQTSNQVTKQNPLKQQRKTSPGQTTAMTGIM